MPNPRNITDFTNLDSAMETFLYDSTIVYNSALANGSAQAGLAVTLSGNADRVVSTVADGEKVVGKLILVESDGFCSVQTRGFCTLPSGTAAAVTIGSAFVGALLVAAEGYIKAAATAGIARGVIVDNDDLANIIVNLNS